MTTGQGPSLGDVVIDPSDGTYINANGKGVLHLDATFNLSQGSFSCTGKNICQGTEEAIIIDILSPPGSPYQPIIGMDDQAIMLSNLPYYPTQLTFPGGDTHCWSLDYASDNPAFVVGYVYGTFPPSTTQPGFSTNYGANRSWTVLPGFPTNSNPAGNIACASVGTDGLISTNKTASYVFIGNGSTTPKYTIDNGSGNNGGWQNCAFNNSLTLPRTFLLTSANLGYPERLVVADRVNIGTYYMYVPGTAQPAGMYYSTDFGAHFSASVPSPGTPFIMGGVQGASAAYILIRFQVMLVTCGQLEATYSTGTLPLSYSTDGQAAVWGLIRYLASAAANTLTWVNRRQAAIRRS